MRISVVFLTSILLIAGCGRANDSASGDGPGTDSTANSEQSGVPGEGLLPGGTTHVFDCGAPGADSISVTVRVDSTRAWVWLPQDIRIQPVRLEQVEAASGAV